MIDLSGLDPVPQITAGIQSISCECGWEKVYILPEELSWQLGDVLAHLGQHGIKTPTFLCTSY